MASVEIEFPKNVIPQVEKEDLQCEKKEEVIPACDALPNAPIEGKEEEEDKEKECNDISEDSGEVDESATEASIENKEEISAKDEEEYFSCVASTKSIEEEEAQEEVEEVEKEEEEEEASKDKEFVQLATTQECEEPQATPEKAIAPCVTSTELDEATKGEEKEEEASKNAE